MAVVRPLLKWLLIGLGALLALGIAVVAAVSLLVDPERLRPAIVTAVQESTGRALALDGTVGLKLLPCCAVEVTDVALGNPPGFAGEPFVQARSARLSIRLWPLLTRRAVEVGNVRISGLRANLVGRKDGSNNWTFTDTEAAETPVDAAGADSGISGIDVAGIRIDDARIDYTDEADDSRYRVEQLQLETGAVREGSPFDLSTSFKLTDLADNSGGTLGLKAKASVAVDGDVTTVKLADPAADLDVHGYGGLDAIRGTIGGPAIDVRLASNTVVEAPELNLELEAAGADLPGGKAPVRSKLSGVRYDADAGAGTVSGFTAGTTLAGVALELAGKGEFGARNNLNGTVRFPEFSPREAMAKLGEDVPVTADPNVLRKLSGSTDWSYSDKSVGLDNLAVVLDDTRIAGSLARELLPDGSKAVPRTQFDLIIDAIDVDRYLEPDAPPTDKAGDGGKAAEGPTPIPAEAIRGLNLQGRARVGRLTINDLKLQDLDAKTTAQGGRLVLEPLAAKLYGGSLRGGLRLDASGAKSQLKLDQEISGIDFGALLAEVSDVKNITGTVNLKLASTATGATDEDLLKTLGGNLDFALTDGVYKGMDVWYEIRRARALIRRKEAPVRSGPEETPIRALELAGKLTDGVLRTDKLSAEIPFLRVSGDATVDLPKAALNSKLTALVFEKPVFGDDTSLEDLVNMSLPLTVSGPVADPKVGVDLSKMVRAVVTESVRKSLEDKLREKLGLPGPAEETPPADGEQAAPPPPTEDPVNKLLDRLFKK